jgi:hypothetical protein
MGASARILRRAGDGISPSPAQSRTHQLQASGLSCVRATRTIQGKVRRYPTSARTEHPW